MTDMIEKLARRLFAFDNGDLYTASAAWDREKIEEPERANIYYGQARAALEALRTPTNEMIEAGINRGRRDDLYTDVEHCFQVMVDKALGRVDLPVGEEQQA